MNQKTATTPTGRDRLTGQPLRMAETIAQLDGPIYVERVALFDSKHRNRAKRAIHKALRLQVENRGLGFVEVLAECPTHLKLTPVETEEWVKECMVPVFPLGVKKDLDVEPWFDIGRPSFEPQRLIETIGGTDEATERFGDGFPDHLDAADVEVKFAGSGGDGAQTIAMLTCQAAINEGWDSTYIPSYGPESRGGTSYADIHIARDEVLSPAAPTPQVLVAFNAPSLDKFGPTVRPGGIVLYDSSVIKRPPELDASVRLLGAPMTEIAPRARQAGGQERSGAGRFPGGHRSLPGGDLPHCVAPDPEARRGHSGAQQGGLLARQRVGSGATRQEHQLGSRLWRLDYWPPG